MLIRLT